MYESAIRARGPIPALRHACRIAANRAWSFILKRGLREAGDLFNVDFTSRILGGSAIVVGSRFHGGRGLKIVVAQPNPIGPVLRIGNGVCLNEYVTLAAFDAVTIGDNVLVGSRVYIGNVNHGYYRARRATPARRLIPVPFPDRVKPRSAEMSGSARARSSRRESRLARAPSSPPERS